MWEGCYWMAEVALSVTRRLLGKTATQCFTNVLIKEDGYSLCHNLDQKPTSSESTPTTVSKRHACGGRLQQVNYTSESVGLMVNSVPMTQKHKITGNFQT